ncbi:MULTISPECIES: alpha/beta fold hydrolase [Amycolatopsis]|uniref:Alpha/beta hydrolase n=1 Tax=Amycolatopsis thermalba TaxID=944492 RepID=A0ABY4NX06_9PSEU|nr:MULTISPECIES: alpha/beta hydrolase [Amycolatopsis]OXM72396.1 alpha/beta hydrolase [Amycolatopsis sp. KNN50.9b]UQS24609.1 alpha/beta hydrolase [Amycolatopsis thermalba]
MFATAADGTKIWYDTAPGPRPVLLIHGFASDSLRTWEQTGWIRALAGHGHGHGHVTVDLRGHGQSDRPASGYSPRTLARDVLAVLDEAGLSTVDVVTYSMGGLAGWELARLAPGRVGRMVLGGIGGRAADRASMERVAEQLSGGGLDACIDGMAGHRLDGAPPVPVLFAAGEQDEIAADAPEFAASLGAPFVSLGRRTHLNAVSSRKFKDAAIEFLAPAG